ncbi:MAG: hypothetical protein JSS81_02335 [Acidobacteria bacterium]|nr:hypothetical protein [Acidobacteriota bacterium]
MKHLILTAILILAGWTGAAAQPKTVTDYFLAMPAETYATDIDGQKFKDRAALTKYRKSLIKIEDVKNGYLKLEGAWEGWSEIALFKRRDGGYLVAETSVGCGPACVGGLKLSTYTNGKWTDVTKQFQPVFTDAEAFAAYKSKGGDDDEIKSGADLGSYYLLPRAGRTVKIACNECGGSGDGEDFVFLEFEWNGDKFVRK